MKLHTAISLILASSAQALKGQDACYSELGSSMRPHDTFSYQSAGHCMEKCRDEGFNYAAIQNLKCYCGAGKPSDDKEVSSDKCDTPCAGWPNDICGGKNAWSLYTADNVLELPPSADPSNNSEKASSSTSESQSASESATATSGVSAAASVSSPVKSTTISSNGSSRTGSASSTSSSPGAPGSSSSTAVTPTSSTSGGNRRYRFLF